MVTSLKLSSNEPLEITDGMITVPQSFGLGVTVDRAKVEELGTKN